MRVDTSSGGAAGSAVSAPPPAGKGAPGLRRAAVALGVLALLVLFEAAVLAGPGRLKINQMEGDVLHLIDGLARMAAGYRPHIDFSTPLGSLSFLPLSIWGLPPQEAFVRGNVVLAVAVLPFAAWLAATRLSLPQTLWIGAAAIVAACAVTWSADAQGLSFATHYNRWAWALTIAALPVAMVAPARISPGVDLGDGIALGVAAAALVFLKATYAVALVPLWLVWAIGRPRAALVSATVGIAAAVAIASVSGGIEGVQAYVSDLVAAATSDVRPEPGRGFFQVASHPSVAPITVGLVVASLTLVKCGMRREAALWAAGLLALVAIAWQNFGNHMTGALAAPPLLMAIAPRAPADVRTFGMSAPMLLRAIAIGLGFVTAPYFAGLERSVFGGWTIDESRSVALFAEQGAPGLWFEDDRDQLRGVFPLKETERTTADARTFGGVAFPSCSSADGYEASVADAGQALAADARTAGRRVLTADLVDPVWWAAGAPPPPKGALWRYGPLGDAIDSLDLLAVPACPANPAARNRTLDELAEAGIPMRVVLEIPGWTVFERIRG